MSDVERIAAMRSEWDGSARAAHEIGRLEGAAAERVRVVEGLVTTIKAQLRFSPMARTDEAVMRGDPDNGDYILRAKVLEALEAAREDTT